MSEVNVRLAKPNNAPRYRKSIERLMPRGFAWPKHGTSAQAAWIKAQAEDLNEFETFTYRTIEQWWPHQTCSRVLEWAKATGLPDKCFPDADEIGLRGQMLGRLRGVSNLPYDDSSPACPEYIKALCATIGYTVEVWYSWPFRFGRERFGDRFGLLNGVLNIQVVRVCEPFRFGEHRFGRRFIECTQDSLDLICFLKRIVPARYQIRTIF